MIRFSLSGPILFLLIPWLCPEEPSLAEPPQELRQLTSHGATDYHPVFSPSGIEVLFTSRREEDAALIRTSIDGGLWLVDSRGGNPEQLTDFPGSEGNPAWSPNCELVVFTSDRSGNLNLWVLSLREE